MKATQHNRLGWIVTEGEERYVENYIPQATSRVLNGSYDHGFWAEYAGYGHIDGVPVKAVYLFDDDHDDIEDEADFDWEAGIANGRFVVMVDELSHDDYHTLTTKGELSKNQ